MVKHLRNGPPIILTFSLSVVSREVGETEITTEDGIEVFQNEKFIYLNKGFHYIAAGMNFNPTLHSHRYNPEDVRNLCERKKEWEKQVKDLPTMLQYLSRHHRL